MKIAYLTVRHQSGHAREFTFSFLNSHEFMLRLELIILDETQMNPGNPIKSLDITFNKS